MARILLGSTTTNSNGVATLNYNSQGRGKLNIIAVTTIDGDTISSEEYELWDCLFYDTGFESTNTKWTLGSVLTRSVSDNGTTLSMSGTGTTTNNFYQLSTTALTGNWEATIYVNNPSDISIRFGFISGGTKQYVLRTYVGAYYIKLIRENGTTKAYLSDDGETWSSKSMSGTEPSSDSVNLYIGQYNASGSASSFTYRDLKVYSI